MSGTRPTDRSVYEDGTPTACVVIVHSNKNDGKTFHVHDAECGDSRKYHDDADAWDFPTEVRDKRDVVDDTYGPGAGSFYTESGWEGMADGSVTEAHHIEIAWREYLHDFRFFPCVNLPEDIGGLRWSTREPDALTVEREEAEEVRQAQAFFAEHGYAEGDEPTVAYDGPASEPEDEGSDVDFTVEPLGKSGHWVRITDKVVEGASIDVHRTDIPALIAALAKALLQEDES